MATWSMGWLLFCSVLLCCPREADRGNVGGRPQDHHGNIRTHLVTQFYVDLHGVRAAELEFALCRNLCNPHIDHIHLLEPESDTLFSHHNTESSSPSLDELFAMCAPRCAIDKGKLILYKSRGISSRLRFSEAIGYAYSLAFRAQKDSPWHPSEDAAASACSQPIHIVMVSNADIYFDETLHLLKSSPTVYEDLVKHRENYYLSRYEPPTSKNPFGTQCGPLYQDSHDTFIFGLASSPSNGPSCVSPRIESLSLDYLFLAEIATFELGTWGIENRIMYELRHAGTFAASIPSSRR
jgi:hypothetical protein